MRVLMLTHWFQPEPVFRGLPLLKGLQRRGHSVEVLTGFPHYPGGKLYPGYSIRPWQREILDGIRVTRVPVYPSHDRSGFRRVLNYLSHSVSAALLGPFLTAKPDVIYVFSLITLGWVARLLRLLKGSRIVFDVQDLWPESVAQSGMLRNGVALELLQAWSSVEYSRSDRLITLSPGFKRNLMQRGISGDRIDVIYNWCDEDSIALGPQDEALRSALGFAGRFNVVFAGTMGVMQGLDTVVEAASRLKDLAPHVLFTFIGGGVEVDRLKELARGLDNVQFLPRRPVSDIGPVLMLADALLVHLKDNPVFSITIPSKIQAYMYAGRPILCGVRGDAAHLVQQAGAGVAFEPENADSLVGAINQLTALSPAEREEMGASGRGFYLEYLSYERGVKEIERTLELACAET